MKDGIAAAAVLLAAGAVAPASAQFPAIQALAPCAVPCRESAIKSATGCDVDELDCDYMAYLEYECKNVILAGPSIGSTSSGITTTTSSSSTPTSRPQRTTSTPETSTTPPAATSSSAVPASTDSITDNQTKKADNSAVIVGSVVGAWAAALIIAGLLFWRRRKQRRSAATEIPSSPDGNDKGTWSSGRPGLSSAPSIGGKTNDSVELDARARFEMDGRGMATELPSKDTVAVRAYEMDTRR